MIGTSGMNEAEFNESLAVYMDEASYGPFDTYQDGRMQEACIDPRDTDQPSLRIDVQSPGGTVGRATDIAVVRAAYNESPMADGWAMNEAFREGRRDRVSGSHLAGCKYIAGRAAVLGLMRSAKDESADVLDGWSRRYFRTPRQADRAFGVVREGVAIAVEYVTLEDGSNEDDFADLVRLDAGSGSATPTMVGANRAGMYVVNHALGKGLDRQRILRGESPSPVTAYHDSLGADIARIDALMDGQPRDDRVAVRMLRSLATRTAVALDLAHLEVADDGPRLTFVRTA